MTRPVSRRQTKTLRRLLEVGFYIALFVGGWAFAGEGHDWIGGVVCACVAVALFLAREVWMEPRA